MGSGGKVLVTGADGFIGSHLTEALVARGRAVRAMVLYNSFSSWGWLDALPPGVLSAVEVVAGDVRDPDSAAKAVRGCDTVLHLAALIAIPYSYEAPSSYLETNVAGTLNLLRAARDSGVAKFVQTSTSEVYGSARRVPIDEEHPLSPQSPYAASKVGADQMALSFYRSYGLPVAVCRPFNTYGPRQSARAVIPTIVTQLAAGTREVLLGALRPTRDFSYVTDTAAGLIAVADSDRTVGEVVNLGSGHEVSIADLLTTIASLMGVEARAATERERVRPEASEVDRLLADHGKATRLTSWRPEYAGAEGLARGLRRTIAWFADPANLARYRPGRYEV